MKDPRSSASFRVTTAIASLVGLAGALFVGLLALGSGEEWIGPAISPWLRGIVTVLCALGAYSCGVLLVRSLRR
ncbi:MAG TPA: hypothetical protein VG318_15590 [Actinomycetota bacterium]|nr:hypothetical protein [Actinomycetota bacterium]